VRVRHAPRACFAAFIRWAADLVLVERVAVRSSHSVNLLEETMQTL
jgi:hypothetical protein